jgi:predicted nucleic acid-binding protein
VRTLAALELLVISPQVMNEFANAVLRKMPHIAGDDLISALEEQARWCSAPMTSETTLDGLVVHRRYGFSFYDSTLIAAALLSGCDVFLSEDLSDGQWIGDLRIINPFASAPDAVLKS